jgi:signal transduction histidine kinase
LREGADADPDLRVELLAGMEGQIDQMQPLLDDLTQLHGQVFGLLELHRQATPLSQWLPQTMAVWREVSQERGIRWQANIPLNLPVVEIDTNQLGRALGNLYSNAVKYTPSGGTICVEAGVHDGEKAGPNQWWLRISDNGPGISPDELSLIFEPFQRVQQDRRFPQGMGLGLTIARDLIEAHGGTIEVASTPGQGSQFTVALPVSS